jgi:hypothetical protein
LECSSVAEFRWRPVARQMPVATAHSFTVHRWRRIHLMFSDRRVRFILVQPLRFGLPETVLSCLGRFSLEIKGYYFNNWCPGLGRIANAGAGDEAAKLQQLLPVIDNLLSSHFRYCPNLMGVPVIKNALMQTSQLLQFL